MSSITVDRTGFPLVRVQQQKLDVHLLPVTKLQFETFLAEPNGFGDTWYQQLLQTNPRCSWRNLRQQPRERVFLTGILPEETSAFARWLGRGFRLPSATEWQAVYCHWLDRRLDLLSQKADAAEVSEQLAQTLLEGRAGCSLNELGYMSGGVLEWVSTKRGWQLIGEPAQTLRPNLFDWRTPVRPTDSAKRCGMFGFRLVRSIEA